MAVVTLKTGASRGLWGLVEVLNVDGTLNRRFKITGAQLAALQASSNGVPPGVTTDEWVSQRAVVYGKDFNVGHGAVSPVGDIIVKLAELVTPTDVREFYLILKSGQYTGIFPQITVPLAVFSTLDPKQVISSMLVDPIVTGLVNGVVTVS